MAVDQTRIEQLLLQGEMENFLYAEADLLDNRRYEEWLEISLTTSDTGCPCGGTINSARNPKRTAVNWRIWPGSTKIRQH